jgi:hypothetical protein
MFAHHRECQLVRTGTEHLRSHDMKLLWITDLHLMSAANIINVWNAFGKPVYVKNA